MPRPARRRQVDAGIGAVVVGWDPHFSYSRVVYASTCLRELPGCALVATNLDCADKIGSGSRMMPGTGGLVAAVEVASGVKAVSPLGLRALCVRVRGCTCLALCACTRTCPCVYLCAYGRERGAGTGAVCPMPELHACRVARAAQVNVGKGGTWLLPFLCRELRLDPSRTAIVGDRMDTDIHLGRQGGNLLNRGAAGRGRRPIPEHLPAHAGARLGQAPSNKV